MNESALKEAICDYVDEAKVHGWPVERAIIEIKRISEVEDGPLHRSLNDPIRRETARSLISRMIAWCIEHYFRTAA